MSALDHHSDFENDVESQIKATQKNINDGIDYVNQKWQESIIAKGLDSKWAWVVSPGLKAAYEWAKGNLEDDLKSLVDEFTKFSEDVWEKIKPLTGDPFALVEMSDNYINASKGIRDELITIQRITSRTREDWDGDAFTAYDTVKDEQVTAIGGVSDGLKSAGDACAAAAQQVRSIWRDCIDALLDIADAILDAIKDGTDAGEWVTFDAGPAIKVIGKCLTSIERFVNNLERYFDDNATVNHAMWLNLNGGLPGLGADSRWPKVTGHYSGEIGDSAGYSQH